MAASSSRVVIGRPVALRRARARASALQHKQQHQQCALGLVAAAALAVAIPSPAHAGTYWEDKYLDKYLSSAPAREAPAPPMKAAPKKKSALERYTRKAAADKATKDKAAAEKKEQLEAQQRAAAQKAAKDKAAAEKEAQLEAQQRVAAQKAAKDKAAFEKKEQLEAQQRAAVQKAAVEKRAAEEAAAAAAAAKAAKAKASYNGTAGAFDTVFVLALGAVASAVVLTGKTDPDGLLADAKSKYESLPNKDGAAATAAAAVAGIVAADWVLHLPLISLLVGPVKCVGVFALTNLALRYYGTKEVTLENDVKVTAGKLEGLLPAKGYLPTDIFK